MGSPADLVVLHVFMYVPSRRRRPGLDLLDLSPDPQQLIAPHRLPIKAPGPRAWTPSEPHVIPTCHLDAAGGCHRAGTTDTAILHPPSPSLLLSFLLTLLILCFCHKTTTTSGTVLLKRHTARAKRTLRIQERERARASPWYPPALRLVGSSARRDGASPKRTTNGRLQPSAQHPRPDCHPPDRHIRRLP